MQNVRPLGESAETPEKILDAAETLFAEHGYAATSMRAIAREAGVNLAATNYHFGSKLGLLEAVFTRRVAPVNDRRLLLLKALEESNCLLTTHEILEAFFIPVAEMMPQGKVPMLMARMFGEPESLIRPILQKAFGEVAERFQTALIKVQPHLSKKEMQWRFHFMIGSMVHLLQFNAPLGGESSLEKFTEGMERLIRFSVAGLEQPVGETHA